MTTKKKRTTAKSASSSQARRKPATSKVKKKNLIGVDPLAWMSESEVGDVDSQGSLEQVVARQDIETLESGDTGTKDLADDKPSVDNRLDLGNALSIKEVEVLHEKLQRLDLSKGAVELNIAGIEKTDAAGMQLLTAFQQHVSKQGVKIEWTGSSQALTAAVSLLGLNSQFEL